MNSLLKNYHWQTMDAVGHLYYVKDYEDDYNIEYLNDLKVYCDSKGYEYY